MMAGLLRVAYRLRYHRFAGWSLDRWLVTLLLLAACLSLLLGRSRMPASQFGGADSLWGLWLTAAGCAFLALAVLAMRAWAAQRMYMLFTRRPDPPPSGRALDPTEKVLLHATGQFEVEGKSHFFADILAYWRTFATREHAVMAIVHASRYLLLGTIPGEDLGMWYIFFRPEMLRSVVAGELRFGSVRRPALLVTYQPALSGAGQGRRGTKASPLQSVYLAFDDPAARSCVWADLLAG
jgi:hypothetical protein